MCGWKRCKRKRRKQKGKILNSIKRVLCTFHEGSIHITCTKASLWVKSDFQISNNQIFFQADIFNYYFILHHTNTSQFLFFLSPYHYIHIHVCSVISQEFNLIIISILLPPPKFRDDAEELFNPCSWISSFILL